MEELNTLNRVLIWDNYPLPQIEDIFAALQGGKLFSKKLKKLLKHTHYN